MLNKKALAGTAGAPKVYVEDVFSTYLYTGNGSTQTITNNIDLSTEGGLVWLKERSPFTSGHKLYDTQRGTSVALSTNNTDGNSSPDAGVTAFNANGFSLSNNNNTSNVTNSTYASWTFRKAKKFFDIVTYTGNGSNRTISHNLGSTPGWIIVKRTDATAGWPVYHRSIGATKALELQITNAAFDSSSYWNNTEPTSTVFTVGTDSYVNANGGTYVAYLFAHDAGGFGDAGSDNVISCGSFTTDGSGAATVTLGYEPQWVLLKSSTTTTQWIMLDTMRGWTNPANNARLFANLSNAESGDGQAFPTATGFGTSLNASQTFIYIAIRRGPMKTPTSGTSVLWMNARSGTATNNLTVTGVAFPPDLLLSKGRTSTPGLLGGYTYDRLRGKNLMLQTQATNAELSTAPSNEGLMGQSNYVVDLSDGFLNNGSTTYIDYLMRRAPGFFDVVCYTGTGSAGQTYNHNLGVVPELIIVKRRSGISDWSVYSSTVGATGYLLLNTTDASVTGVTTRWNDTAPTSTVFSTGTASAVNGSGSTYVAYLFASVSGVSKVGSYTGNGSSVTVTTGFQPRFILVKRTDSTGNWIVGDSARGLPAGNDPALFLNTTDAETTGQDWVDVSSTGFTVNSTALNANVNTATYLYLAVA